MTHSVLDLYAGVGIGVATRDLGVTEHGVEVWESAIALREANDMGLAYRDVWDIERAADFDFDTLWASPPCQMWSNAGKGQAREKKGELLQAIADGAWMDIGSVRALGVHLGNVEYAHVLIPLAYIWRYRPTYVALEQVPSVLPVWEAYEGVMRWMGYSTWSGVLRTEQFGVPQTRKRAILMARLDGVQVQPPTPSHSRYYERDRERLDEGVLRWVTMREALGPIWEVDRPAPTVTGGGTATGGAEPFGNGGRKAIRAAIELWNRGRPQGTRGADSDATSPGDHREGRSNEVDGTR